MLEAEGLDREDGGDQEEDDEATIIETAQQRRERISQANQNMLVDESIEVEDAPSQPSDEQ